MKIYSLPSNITLLYIERENDQSQEIVRFARLYATFFYLDSLVLKLLAQAPRAGFGLSRPEKKGVVGCQGTDNSNTMDFQLGIGFLPLWVALIINHIHTYTDWTIHHYLPFNILT